jgi:hypothetical protein
MNDIKNVDDISTLNKEDLLKDQASSTTKVEADVEAGELTGEEPPDGGWEAWLVAIGACCVSTRLNP